MDKKREIHPHHIHISASLITIILLSVVILLLIFPAFQNYAMQKDFRNLGENPQEILEKIQDQEHQIITLKSNVSSLNTAILDQRSLREDLQIKHNACTIQNQELTAEINSLTHLLDI